MRVLLPLAVMFVVSCNPAPRSALPAVSDPAREASYLQSVEQLVLLRNEAAAARSQRQSDRAAELITKAQPLISQVLGVPRPTLAAMEVSSDLDDIYGRMLLANRHFGAARLMFQKNVARWTHWRPQTENTRKRKEAAESAVAECDRHIGGKL